MKFPENFIIEKDLHLNKGVKYIAGVDEVGRGPLAGPLVVGAVILDIQKLLELESEITRNNDVSLVVKNRYRDITDSKKISPNKREILSDFIYKECLSFSITELSNEEIDTNGIGQAVSKAFDDAVNTLGLQPDFVITDAVSLRNWDSVKQLNVFSADLKSITVGAASIIAKVYRDKIMENMDTLYPHYGFFHNKGYGTKQHMEALKIHGPCPIHRKSYYPVSSWINP